VRDVLGELDEAVGDQGDADDREYERERHPAADDGRGTGAEQADRADGPDQADREGGRIDELQLGVKLRSAGLPGGLPGWRLGGLFGRRDRGNV
jgi:hypothetical protein